MGCTNKPILITIILMLSFTTSLLALATVSSYPKDFKRHASPLIDWEPGLKEATRQVLLRNRNLSKSIRDKLLTAPIIGKENRALPFGDIALLARGQLFAIPEGFRFIQDPYQNDCIDCHPRRFCKQNDCGVYKTHGSEKLLALWSIKRIRHRSGDLGHRYELEYTISPINSHTQNTYLNQFGGFNYNIPGHVFIVKTSNDQPDFVKVYHNDHFVSNSGNWNNRKYLPAALPPPPVDDYYLPIPSTQGTAFHPLRPSVPHEYLPGHHENRPNYQYLPQKPTQTYFGVPTAPGTKFPSGYKNDLYKKLLESLAQKTSSVPPKSIPHRFGPPTKTTKPFIPTSHHHPITTQFHTQTSSSSTTHTIPSTHSTTHTLPSTVAHVPSTVQQIPTPQIPTSFIPMHTHTSGYPTQAMTTILLPTSLKPTKLITTPTRLTTKQTTHLVPIVTTNETIYLTTKETTPYITMKQTTPHATMKQTTPHTPIKQTTPHTTIKQTTPYVTTKQTTAYLTTKETTHLTTKQTTPHTTTKQITPQTTTKQTTPKVTIKHTTPYPTKKKTTAHVTTKQTTPVTTTKQTTPSVTIKQTMPLITTKETPQSTKQTMHVTSKITTPKATVPYTTTKETSYITTRETTPHVTTRQTTPYITSYITTKETIPYMTTPEVYLTVKETTPYITTKQTTPYLTTKETTDTDTTPYMIIPYITTKETPFTTTKQAIDYTTFPFFTPVLPTKLTLPPTDSTKSTDKPTMSYTTTYVDTSKPIPTFFIDPTHPGYPRTTPITPFTESYNHGGEQTQSTAIDTTASTVYQNYTGPETTSNTIITTISDNTAGTTTLQLPASTDRYFPETTPHVIKIPVKIPKPNTPFIKPNVHEIPGDDYSDYELFPEDKNKSITTTPATTSSTGPPKPTEGFLLREEEYYPNKLKEEEVEKAIALFDKEFVRKPKTEQSKIIITPTPNKEFNVIFENVTNANPSNEENDDDGDLFGSVKLSTERYQIIPTADSFEDVQQNEKIIYSGFFEPSTTSAMITETELIETTTVTPAKTKRKKHAPTEPTKQVDEISTKQSFSTSVSYKVNKYKRRRAPTRLPVLKKLTTIRSGDKSEIKYMPKHVDSKTDDNTSDLVQVESSNPKGIDLGGKNNVVKYKRKSYTRNRKVKKRIEN